MYKVFFNDKELILQKEQIETFKNAQDCAKLEDISNFIYLFLTDNEILKAQLYGKRKKKLLQNLKKYFKYIEAAGGLVFNAHNEFLLIERLGKPDLPKGKIEKGEKPKTAALREVQEECGIKGMRIISKLPSSYHIYFMEGQYVLKKTYWFSMCYEGGEDPTPQAEENITTAEFVSCQDAEKYAQKTYKNLKYMFDVIDERNNFS